MYYVAAKVYFLMANGLKIPKTTQNHRFGRSGRPGGLRIDWILKMYLLERYF